MPAAAAREASSPARRILRVRRHLGALLVVFAACWAVGAVGSYVPATQDDVPAANPIGGNVDGIDYRGRTQMYVNLVRQAQPFMSLANSSARASTDDEGWPTEPFSVYLQTMGADLAGNYSVSIVDRSAAAAGVPAAVSIVSAADGVVVGQHPDPSVPGLLLATLVISDVNATDIALNVTGVSPAGATNLSVLLPGFERADVLARSTPTAAGQPPLVAVPVAGTQMPKDVVHPRYLQQLSRFSILRTLALNPFDRDFVANWSSRATASNSPSWSGFCCPITRSDNSLPWEQLVDFINAVPGSPALWINVPLTADDEYYANLAALLHSRLPSSTPLYVQYDNELWNGGFEAERVLRQLANSSVELGGDPYHLNYDGVDNDIIWGARLAAYQATVRLPKLFAQAFGAGNVGPAPRQVRPILAGQTNYAAWMEDQLSYLTATQHGAVNLIGSGAIAYYFNLQRGDMQNNTLTGPQVLESLNTSLVEMAPNLTAQWAAHAATAIWYGLPEMRGYEGGPATFGAQSIPGKVVANESPVMQELVEQMYAQWHGYGFDALNFWHAGAQDYNWPFGQWTLTWRWDVPDTAKTAALDAVRSRPRPEPTIGETAPFQNHSASYYVGYYASPTRPTPPHITYVP